MVKVRLNYMDLCAANTLGRLSRTLQFMVRQSTFNFLLVSEVAILCSCFLIERTWDEQWQDVHTLVWDIFSGWGTTKVIEDIFNRLRDSKTMTTQCNHMCLFRQWSVVMTINVLLSFKRRCVYYTCRPFNRNTRGLPAKLHNIDARKPSVDLHSIDTSLQLPTFGPLSADTLYAQTELFRYCYVNDCMEDIKNNWKVCILPVGTVFRHEKDPDIYYVSLGSTGFCALFVWPFVPVKVHYTVLYQLCNDESVTYQ